MEKLKPCPQGHNNTLLFQELPSLGGKNDGYYFHECEICGWRGPKKKTPESAISAWNTRSEPVPTIPLSRLDEWVDDFNRQMLEDPWAFDHEMDQENMIAWISDLIDLLNEEETQ